MLKSELSVRQTELLAKKLMAETPEKPAKDPLSVNYAEEAARELGERLGRGCRIVSGRKKGRIELEYYGTDDLERSAGRAPRHQKEITGLFHVKQPEIEVHNA